MAQRSWQALAGVVTVLLIALKLNADQQGWYYTFLSVAALYTFFEMGLSSAVLQFAAHRFVEVVWTQVGGVEGPKACEFNSFFAQSVKFYICSAALFFAVVLVVGVYLFSYRQEGGQFGWIGAWSALVLVTAANLLTLPFLAVREGSGHLVDVYLIKIVQGVLGSVACWVVLLNNGFLWATVMPPLVAFVVFAIWLTSFVPRMISIVKDAWSSKVFSWASGIWPLQWRVGVGFVSVFMWSQLGTPILFYYQDAVAAGQMGLSLTVAHTVGLVSQSWIATGIPEISRAAVLGDLKRWSELFKRKFFLSCLVFIVASISLLCVIFILLSDSSFSTRFLPTKTFFMLFLFVFFNFVSSALATQLRALNKEPLAFVFLFGALVTVIGSLLIAPSYGATGVVAVMLGAQILCVFPLSYMIWRIVSERACSIVG